ncbi:MAG: YiiD C-terminal domain-containing protein [Gemmatimonadales bacterium]
MNADGLQALLATELPITQHLGIEVVRLDESGVELRLPLAANRNHKGALFAGSLNAAATLAGWGVLVAALETRGVDALVVIQDSSVRYLSPVRSDAIARCAAPAAEALDTALRTLQRRGLARLALTAEIGEGKEREPAVRFTGRYVLHRPGPDVTRAPAS